MKTIKFIFVGLSFFTSVYVNAQFKVLSFGRVVCENQTAIYSNPNNISDGMDIVYSNPLIPNSYDVIWAYSKKNQPNNPGLLSLQSVDGAYFTVRANGRVGIYNNNPSCALEVGTAGTNYEIKVNGSIVLASDERVKENIRNIDKSLGKLKLLKTVSYNFKGVSESKSEDTLLHNSGIENKPAFKPRNNKDSYGRMYYGFLAQDVQKLFPDLVYEDSAGLLSIDYIGIIPLLVNALNEQEITINAQTEKIADLKLQLLKLENSSGFASQKVGAKISEEQNISAHPLLNQNTPNPFNIETKIGFYLPNSIITASLYVYDMNGNQLKSYSINERGKGNIIIQGYELNAGMYLYTLIADNDVIDTKRMILTK